MSSHAREIRHRLPVGSCTCRAHHGKKTAMPAVLLHAYSRRGFLAGGGGHELSAHEYISRDGKRKPATREREREKG